jgi:FtsH-binding integral membrane protein
MVDNILSLNPWLGLIVFIFIFLIIGTGSYLLGWFLLSKYMNKETEKAGTMLFRSVTVLLGLMFAISKARTPSRMAI